MKQQKVMVYEILAAVCMLD